MTSWRKRVEEYVELRRSLGFKLREAKVALIKFSSFHRFAVKTLIQWYRSGQDVERRLPVLSTYLGHVHVADTYWYLSACPELMGLAVKRFEDYWEKQS